MNEIEAATMAIGIATDEIRRLRGTLEEIRDADPVDMALDPNWPARIAKAALEGQ